ncbi:MAG: response regulator transcription factor [Anaerolineales bacterium]|nr:response regulator transcription factor [Anaerolineales bacterium]
MAKILIVDDDVEVTTLFEKFLTVEGYEAVGLNESASAVDLANSIIPDLFILDLMMPQPDGFKLCRMLRAIPKFKHTPILIITALGDSDSRVVAFGAGADDYLQKPFHIAELAKRIKALI